MYTHTPITATTARQNITLEHLTCLDYYAVKGDADHNYLIKTVHVRSTYSVRLTCAICWIKID